MSSADRPISFRRLRLGTFLLIALLAVIAASKAILVDSIDPDCWLHLLIAGRFWREGLHPLVDTWSFASVRTPWTPFAWLGEFAMLAVWNAGGYRLAVAVHAIMNAALLTLIALCCIERTKTADLPAGRRMASVAAMIFAAMLSLAYLSFRPVTLALVLLALAAWLLVRDRRLGERSRAVWSVVPLTVLCINVHLYAVFIPMWIAALLGGAAIEYWLAARRTEVDRPLVMAEQARRLRRDALMLVACGLACLATPLLPGVVATALQWQRGDPIVAARAAAEYRVFYAGAMGTVSAVLAMAMLACMVANQRRLRIGDWFWLAIGVLLVLRMGRFWPVFAIIAAPLFAATLPDLRDAVLARPPIIAALATLLLLAVGRLAWAFPAHGTTLDQWLNRVDPASGPYPVGAAAFVERHVTPRTGHLIDDYTWGGYLEWRLNGQFQVLMDGRTNLYTTDFWQQTRLAPSDAIRQRYLQTLTADAAIVPDRHGDFAKPLQNLGWVTAYDDGVATVMLPPTPSVSDASR